MKSKGGQRVHYVDYREICIVNTRHNNPCWHLQAGNTAEHLIPSPVGIKTHVVRHRKQTCVQMDDKKTARLAASGNKGEGKYTFYICA